MKYTIFCERVFDDETFEELKAFIKKKGAGKCNLYCVAPVNHPLAVAEQGCQLSKEEFGNLLAERYRELQDRGCSIQLHLHLSLRPEKMDQEPLFQEATSWMLENGFSCREVAYGWYVSSAQSREMEKKYGLWWAKGKWQMNLHDYEIHGNIFSPIMILQNLRNCLR